MMSDSMLSRLTGEGRQARRDGKSKEACPYDTIRVAKRCAWLAGWHDQDIAMQQEPEPKFTEITAAREEAEFLADKYKSVYAIVDCVEHLVVRPIGKAQYAKDNIVEEVAPK